MYLKSWNGSYVSVEDNEVRARSRHKAPLQLFQVEAWHEEGKGRPVWAGDQRDFKGGRAWGKTEKTFPPRVLTTTWKDSLDGIANASRF